MALGYCPVCEKLVPIRPTVPLDRSKWPAMDWKPEPHDAPTGEACPGFRRVIL